MSCDKMGSVKWLKIPNDYNEMCRCGESDSVRFITGSVGLNNNRSNSSYHISAIGLPGNSSSSHSSNNSSR